MLDGLSRGDQPGVKRWSALVFRSDLLALFDDAIDGRAGLALCALADKLEDLLQALDLALGLVSVFLEGLLQVRRLRGRAILGSAFSMARSA